MKVSAEFIERLEEQVSVPWFVREWFRNNVPQSYLTKEGAELLKTNPHAKPSKEEVEVLEDFKLSFSSYIPSFTPYLVEGIYRVKEFHYCYAWDRGVVWDWLVPKKFNSVGRYRFLYFETLEDMLSELIELACILTAFSEAPKQAVEVVMPPDEESFKRAYDKYRKSTTIAPHNAAIEGSQKYIKGKLMKRIKIELSPLEIAMLKVSELRKSLKFILEMREKELEEKLLSIAKNTGKYPSLIEHIFSSETFCSYLEYFPSVYLYEIYDNYHPEFDFSEQKQSDFTEFDIMKRENPLYIYAQVLGRAIYDYDLTGENFLREVIKILHTHTVEKGYITPREFTVYVTDFLGDNKGKKLLKSLGIAVDISAKEIRAKLRKMHRRIMKEFESKALSGADKELIKEAYELFTKELSPGIIKDIADDFFASVVNVINYLIVIEDDLDRAKSLLCKAEEAGLANVAFLELYGKLGETYVQKFQVESSFEEEHFLMEAKRWLGKLFDIVYLREQMGELQDYIHVNPLIYWQLFNYISILLYTAVYADEEDENLWDEIGKKIDFTLELIEKYGVSPYIWRPIAVEGALFLMEGDTPKDIIDTPYYEHRLWCYVNKVIYLDYSYEEEKAKEVLNYIKSTTPAKIWDELKMELKEHLESWDIHVNID